MQIVGFFDGMKAANDTVAKLKSNGISKSYLDMNDHYIENRNVITNLAGTEFASSLSELTLGSGSLITDREKSPLAAASPMASGMAGFEEVADINCKVIVNIDDDANMEMAKNIIKDMGGTLQNPNIKTT